MTMQKIGYDCAWALVVGHSRSLETDLGTVCWVRTRIESLLA